MNSSRAHSCISPNIRSPQKAKLNFGAISLLCVHSAETWQHLLYSLLYMALLYFDALDADWIPFAVGLCLVRTLAIPRPNRISVIYTRRRPSVCIMRSSCIADVSIYIQSKYVSIRAGENMFSLLLFCSLTELIVIVPSSCTTSSVDCIFDYNSHRRSNRGVCCHHSRLKRRRRRSCCYVQTSTKCTHVFALQRLPEGLYIMYGERAEPDINRPIKKIEGITSLCVYTEEY